MNTTFHVIFGILAIIFFVFSFFRQKRFYQLLFAIMVAITFLIYASDVQDFRMILAIVDSVIGVAALLLLWVERRIERRNAAIEKAREAARQKAQEEQAMKQAKSDIFRDTYIQDNLAQYELKEDADEAGNP